MTRKDYINIAAAILATQTRIRNDPQSSLYSSVQDQLRGVRRAAAHLADFLKDDNPVGFDQAMFLRNCGYSVAKTGVTETGRTVVEIRDEPKPTRETPNVLAQEHKAIWQRAAHKSNND